MWPPSGGNHVKTWKQHLCGLHNLPGETVAWSFFAVCTSSPVCDGFASGVSKAGQFSRLFLVVFFHLFTILLGLLCRLWSFWGRHGFLLFHFWISFINFSKYLISSTAHCFLWKSRAGTRFCHGLFITITFLGAGEEEACCVIKFVHHCLDGVVIWPEIMARLTQHNK